jgi:Spy/CpxP family protein refolding chaperone
MKTIWKIILGLEFILILILAFFVFRGHMCIKENHRDWRPHFMVDSCHVQGMVNDLSKELSLTEDQKQKILQISYSNMQDMNTIDSKYKNDLEGARKARMEQMHKKMDEIKAVLTDVQKTKFDELLNKRKGPYHGEPFGHWGHGDPRGHHMDGDDK